MRDLPESICPRQHRRAKTVRRGGQLAVVALENSEDSGIRAKARVEELSLHGALDDAHRFFGLEHE